MFEHLDDLYRIHGYHLESLVNIGMKGSDGMKRMEALMQKFRVDPPRSLGGLKVTAIKDYSTGRRIFPGGKSELISGPSGNLLIFETDLPGNYVAARPSGTEPKIKFYLFTMAAAEEFSDLKVAKSSMLQRIAAYAADMRTFADSV